MSPLFLLAAAAFAALAAYALTPFAAWVALKTGAIDQPGVRKIHQAPIPRLGGIAVILSIALTLLAMLGAGLVSTSDLPWRFLLGLSLGILPVLLISIADDIRSVPPLVKFAAHGIGAAIAVSFGLRLNDTVHLFGEPTNIALVAIPLSWLWIVGVTNAFNLADGLDGLSAGLALISAGSLAVVALVLGDAPQAFMSVVLVGALIGFLPFNTYPARIFFGDTGAAGIGFLLACLGLWGTSRLSTGIAVLVPILVMGVPITDALTSMARRSLGRLLHGGRGSVFTADQEHIHHRLLRKGVGHRRAVLLLYGIGLGAAIAGVLSLFMASGRSALVLVTLIIAAGLAIRELDYDEFAVIRNGLVLRMYDVPALRTGAFRGFIDMALVGVAVYAAFVLKFDEWHLDVNRDAALNLFVILMPTTLVSFLTFGLYRRSWRYSNFNDILLTVTAICASSAAGVMLGYLLFGNMPGTTYFVIYTLVLSALVLAVRTSFRALLHWKAREKAGGELVLVYGADMQGAIAFQELFWSRATGFHPVGFIDDDPKNLKRLINGFPVLGDIHGLERVARERGASGLIVASSNVTAGQLETAAAMCRQCGLWLKRFHVELYNVPTGDIAPRAEVVLSSIENATP